MLQKIIPPRLKSAFSKRPPGLSADWRKRILVLIGVAAALLLIGHLSVRFIVWPQIEKSKASVEKLIGARAGVDVSIDDLKVSWTGIRPSFEMNGLRFNSPDKTKSLLTISKIYGELSWKSFYHLAPYFHEIYFENAEIYAQRNAKGAIFIAGISTDGDSNGYTAENWLFSQDAIDINNVNIIWDDKLNKKSPQNVGIQRLTLSNGIRRHQG